MKTAVGRLAGRFSAGGSRSVATRRAAPYSEHQASMGRPVSPHVTVYKQPITAVASIVHRITGVLLALGFAGSGVAAAAGFDVPTAIAQAQTRVPGFSVGAKFLVAFPFALHSLGGVRHMMWDRAPEKITYAHAARSSTLLLAGSVALAAATTAVTIRSPVPRR